MESDILSSDNWNFDKVPDNELVACCYWEYARESVFIRDTLREYRGWILADGKWEERTGKLIAKLEKVQSIGHMSDVFLRGCAFSPAMVRQSDDPKKPDYSHPDAPPISGNFPAPWQSLDEAERKYRARIRTHVEQFQIVPIKLSDWSWAKEIAHECQRAADEQHEQRKAWEREYLHRDKKGNFFTDPGAPAPPNFAPIRPRTRWGVAETLLVGIAWDCFTNDEIVNHFRKWVKLARPKNVKAPSGQGHKPGDWRANLTRLAVMRLLSQFSALQIIRQDSFPAVWETKQFSGRKWGDFTKWRDARREAGKLFRALFPFLPVNDKPLSWERQSPGNCHGV